MQCISSGTSTLDSFYNNKFSGNLSSKILHYFSYSFIFLFYFIETFLSFVYAVEKHFKKTSKTEQHYFI